MSNTELLLSRMGDSFVLHPQDFDGKTGKNYFRKWWHTFIFLEQGNYIFRYDEML